MEQAKYRDCLTNFKERLHLVGPQDLTVLSNCVMSPFPTDRDFSFKIANAFQKVAEDVIKECVFRNEIKPDIHKFILLGTDTPFLVHSPKFNKATHRHQLIMEAAIPDEIMSSYVLRRESNPTAVFTLTTVEKEELSMISAGGSKFQAVISMEITSSIMIGRQETQAFEVTINTVLVNRPLGSKHLDGKYPDQMPFYLFGSYQQLHIDHILLRSPNTQITTDVELVTDNGYDVHEGAAWIAVMDTVQEWAMQPIGRLSDQNVLSPGEKLTVTIYNPIEQVQGPGLMGNLGYPVATGTVTIGRSIYIDSTTINEDPLAKANVQSVPKGWREVWDELIETRST